MSQIQVTGEAKIRDIQGPVVANDGVITALDGAASQYVRGDGTLADFPTSSGGGSSVSYYLNSSVSQGTIGGVAYRELSKEPIIGAGTDIAISANGYVANYLTDANDPDVILVPGGNFNCEFYFSVNNNTGSPTTYAELYKYDGTTFTLLGSSVGVPESLNQGTTIAPYYFAIPVATAALALTDRLAIRIYVNVDGRTVTLHTENGHLCQVVTTFSKGMVSLNNLTDQSQFLTTGTSGTNFAIVSSGDTHTFNLPVASATNTGKLSSTDWSTFNNKQNTITNPITGTGASGQIAYFNSGTSITGENAFNYDASTNRLGVNTTVPNATIGANAGIDSGYSLLLKNDNANYNGIAFATSSTYGNLIATEKLGTAVSRNLTLLNQSGYISINENGNLGVNILSPNAGIDIYNGTTSSLWLHTANSGITGTDGVRLSLFSNNGAVLRNNEGTLSMSSEGDFYVVTLGAENIRVNSADGKVGIGNPTTVPEMLTVNGSIQQSGVLSSLLKTNASGKLIAAVAGTDYVAPASLSAYVPYTGATTNVNLGTFDLTADVITGATGSFASSGSGNTFAINHSSGSGIALNITKGGNGEGLYINKTSGSGNAATIIGTLNATTIVKDGGTSSQYLMADGSVTTSAGFITGSGVDGRVPYFNGTSSITSEAGFIYDSSTNRLGVNTSVPNATIGADAALNSGYGLLIKTGASNYNGIGIAIDSTYGNTIETAKLGTAPARNLTLLNQGGFISITENGNLGVNILTANTGIDIYNSTTSQLWLHNAATGTSATDGVRLALFNNKNANLRNLDGAFSITAEGDFQIITIGAENFRINSANGFVGIGNPASLPSMLTVNGGATITGLTTGQILFPTSGGTLSGSSSLFWDNTNAKLGIGTSTLSGARVTISSATEANHLHLVSNAPALSFTNATTATIFATIGMATSNNNFITGSVLGDFVLGAFNTNNIWFVNNNTNTVRMRLDSDGGGTFSSFVSASGPKSQIRVNGNSVGCGISLTNTIVGANRRNWGIFTEENVDGDFVIKRSTVSGGTANTPVLSLSRDGAATFSSSVTATGAKSQFIANGGNSAGAGISLNTTLTTNPTLRRNWGIFTEDQVEGDFAIKCSTAAGLDANLGNSRLSILSNGNVGIGTSSPLDVASTWTTLEVMAKGSGGGGIIYTSNFGGSVRSQLYSDNNGGRTGTQTNHFFAIETNATERMKIRADGLLLINSLISTFTTLSVANMWVNPTDGSVSRSTASSQRFKENIKDWTDKGLDTILALKPKTFTYKADYYKNPELEMLGLIAEEVAEVSPYLADFENEDRTGQVENVRYAFIVVPLIKAVQELKAEIDQLKALIAAK